MPRLPLVPEESGLPYLRLAALILVVAPTANGRPSPATSGTGLVVAAALVLGVASWATWVLGRGRLRPPAVAGLALSGIVLAYVAPSGPGIAFAYAAVFTALVTRPPSWAVGGCAAISVAAVTAATVAHPRLETSALLSAGFALVVALGLGRRQRQLRLEQTELLLAQTQRAAEEHSRAATLDERARLAREIHDVLSHALAALTIQLEAARATLARVPDASADLEAAIAHVERARSLALEGVSETRRAIEAMRGEPQPLRDGLVGLLRDYETDAGARIRLDLEGAPRALGADLNLALLRICQESLTNCRKHAPGADVDVRLSYEAESVRLLIENEPAQASSPRPELSLGGGLGVSGMRERCRLLGGELTAGRVGDAWRISATLPG